MMTVTCERCSSQQRVDVGQIPPTGMVVRCRSCAGEITVTAPDDEIDLPAPKLPGSLDLPDLDGDITDLPAPKRPPGAGALDLPDLDGEISNLPAPKASASASSLDLPDLDGDITDLPAPKRPPGAGALDLPDLDADLPAPVGAHPSNLPAPKNDGLDLVAPVGPHPSNLPQPADPDLDLPAPVGPHPSNLPAPKDGFDLDLPVPVGPHPSNLPAPAGKHPSNLPAPKGGADGLDLPAPKGFFDDEAAEAAGASAPSLDLNDLELIPADDEPAPAAGPPTSGLAQQDGLDLGAGEGDDAIGGFDLLGGGDEVPPGGDNLSLDGEAPSGGMAFGQVELGGGAEEPLPTDDGISFAPSSSAGAVDTDLDVDENVPAPAARGTLAAEDDAPGAAAERASRDKKAKKTSRKQLALMGGLLGVLVVGAVGYYGWTVYQADQQREATVTAGLADARKLMASDEPGHWDRAAQALRPAVAAAPKNAEALGLRAQTFLAAALDEGRNQKKRIDDASAILNDALRAGATGIEIDKAQALRDLLDGKAADAAQALSNIRTQQRNDANVPLYQGWAFLASRRPDDAKEAFSRALQLVPDRLPALYGLGLAQLAAGASGEARATFQKVLERRAGHVGARVGLAELIPPDAEGTREKRLKEILDSEEIKAAALPAVSRAWSLYGDEALRLGRVNEAAERYLEASKLDESNLAATVGGGLAALEQGKLPEARARLEGAIAQDPAHVRALLGLARIALLSRQPDEAMALVARAEEARPNEPSVHLWKGKVLRAQDKAAEAEEALRKAIELDKESYEAYVELSQLFMARGAADQAVAILGPVEAAAEKEAPLANTLGIAYLKANQYAQAEKWFRTALRIDPKNVDIRANLGAALGAQERLDDAIAELKQAVADANGEREDIALRLARFYEDAERLDAAAALYEELVSGEKASLSAKAAAGRFYARQGQIARGAELGKAILAEDPSHPAGLYLRGLGELEEGMLDDAKSSIQDAISLDPQPRYYHALGKVFMEQNLLEDAMDAYTEAVRRDPKFVLPRIGRGTIRLLRREWHEALEEFRAAAELEPENAAAQIGIGEALFHLYEGSPRAREAVPHLRRAIKLNPNLPGPYYFLGRIYFDEDRGSDTISALKRFVALAPEKDMRRARAWWMLGKTYDAKRNPSEACRAYREVVDLAARDDPRRGDAERYLLRCR